MQAKTGQRGSIPRPPAESAPRGAELVPKTRVTFGSEVRFLRSPRTSGDDAHVGFAQRFAKPPDHGPESSTRLSPSPPSGAAWVSGGEPSPGLPARLSRSPRGKATGCNPVVRGFDSRPRLHFSFCAQGVLGCTPACQFGGAGSTPAGRSSHVWPIGIGTGLPSRRGGFDSRRVLDEVLQGGLEPEPAS